MLPLHINILLTVILTAMSSVHAATAPRLTPSQQDLQTQKDAQRILIRQQEMERKTLMRLRGNVGAAQAKVASQQNAVTAKHSAKLTTLEQRNPLAPINPSNNAKWAQPSPKNPLTQKNLRPINATPPPLYTQKVPGKGYPQADYNYLPHIPAETRFPQKYFHGENTTESPDSE